MDKTLEIILVATTLVVAAVVVISLLQGQSDNFGDFADQQSNSSSCGLGYQQWENSIECNGGTGNKTDRTDELLNRYSGCEWASGTIPGTGGSGPNPDDAC